MLGKLLAVSLVKPDGTLRWFTGHVAEFSLVGSDPGVATYRAVLRPWLWFARQRVNNRVFRDRTLYQQIADILQGHGDWALWQWDVSGDDALFTMAVQGGGEGESEHTIHRRLEARAGPTTTSTTRPATSWSSSTATASARRGRERPPHSLPGRGRAAGGERHPALDASADRRGRAVRGERVRLQAPARHHTDRAQQGRVPELETHEYVGHYGFRKEDPRGAALLNLRREEIEAHAQQYQAEGNNSSVVCGGWFYLFGHFSNTEREEDSQYLIVAASHSASNNYLAELGRQGGHTAEPLPGRKGEYRNRFTAIKRAVPWRPGRGRNSVEVKVDGHQTARVVGRDGLGAVDVDEHGRILIQFHWDREGKHSARVRVASNWAGGETGMVSWPRVGSEVLVKSRWTATRPFPGHRRCPQCPAHAAVAIADAGGADGHPQPGTDPGRRQRSRRP